MTASIDELLVRSGARSRPARTPAPVHKAVVVPPVELDPVVKWRREREAQRHAEKVHEAAILRKEAADKIANLNAEDALEKSLVPTRERLREVFRKAREAEEDAFPAPSSDWLSLEVGATLARMIYACGFRLSGREADGSFSLGTSVHEPGELTDDVYAELRAQGWGTGDDSRLDLLHIVKLGAPQWAEAVEADPLHGRER
jgi:hypothetical protein